MPDEKPSLSWLAEEDWIRVAGIVIWLLQTFLSIAFCIYALVTFAQGQLGMAIVMALLGAVLRPPYGWRG
jgi:hypothetical protein